MADSQDDLGNLNIGITGDYSDLGDALEAAQAAAADAGGAIADALSSGAATSDTALDGLNQQLSLFGDTLADAQQNAQTPLFDIDAIQDANDAIQSVGEGLAGVTAPIDAASAASAEATEALAALGVQVTDTSEAARGAVPAIEGVGEAAHEAGDHAEEAEGGLASFAEALLAFGEALAIVEGLKEFGEEALEVYGTVQKVTVGLTQLTGSADVANEAIESIKNLAATQPFAFPELAPTAQKLVSFGIAAEQLPDVLQAAANAASATGNSFEAVASALGRVNLTGQVSTRQLVQLGVSWQDLASAMGTSIENAQAKLKLGGQSAAQDMEALLTAVNAKFAGASEAQAQTLLGQWQILKNNWEEVMESIGEALAPVAMQIISALEGIIPYIRSAIDTFNELPEPIRDVVVITAALAPIVAAAALAMGGLAAGFSAAATALAPLTELLGPVAPLLGAVAGAFAGPLIASIEATAGNIQALKDRWAELDQEMVNSLILKGLDDGKTLAQLQAMGYSVNQLKTAIGGVGINAASVFQQLSNATVPPIQALTALGVPIKDIQAKLQGLQVDGIPVFALMASSPGIAQFKAQIEQLGGNFDLIISKLNQLKTEAAGENSGFASMGAGIQVLLTGLNQLSPAAQEVIQKQQTLVSNANITKAAYAELVAAFNAGTVSAGVVARAYKEMTDAQSAVNVGAKAAQSAVNALSAAMDKLGMSDAGKQVSGLTAAFNLLAKSGKLTGDQLALAFANLTEKIAAADDGLKALGLKSVTAEMAQLNAAAKLLGDELLAGKISALDFAQGIQKIGEQKAAIQALTDPVKAFQSEIQQADATLTTFANDVIRESQAAQLPLKGIGTEVQYITAYFDELQTHSEASLDAMNAQLVTMRDNADKLASKTENWTKDFTNELNQIGNQFGKLIIQGGSFGSTMTSIVESLAEKIVGTLVDAAFGSLINAITGATTDMKNLGSLFNSLFGTASSGASSAASGAASAGAGAAGSVGGAASGVAGAVSSGLVGIVGAIGSIGSMITGVISDIEGAHDEKTFGEIETNTRQAATVLMQLEPYFADYLPDLAKIAGGSASTGAAIGPDHNDLVNIANILAEMLASMRISTVLGNLPSSIVPGLNSMSAGSNGGASGVVVNMYITSNNPTTIARSLANMLRSRGVQFTPS